MSAINHYVSPEFFDRIKLYSQPKLDTLLRHVRDTYGKALQGSEDMGGLSAHLTGDEISARVQSMMDINVIPLTQMNPMKTNLYVPKDVFDILVSDDKKIRELSKTLGGDGMEQISKDNNAIGVEGVVRIQPMIGDKKVFMLKSPIDSQPQLMELNSKIKTFFGGTIQGVPPIFEAIRVVDGGQQVAGLVVEGYSKSFRMDPNGYFQKSITSTHTSTQKRFFGQDSVPVFGFKKMRMFDYQ